MSFPHRLVALRKEHGITRQALADIAGLNVIQIRRWETGASQPSVEALKKLAKALRTAPTSCSSTSTARTRRRPPPSVRGRPPPRPRREARPQSRHRGRHHQTRGQTLGQLRLSNGPTGPSQQLRRFTLSLSLLNEPQPLCQRNVLRWQGPVLPVVANPSATLL
ncbi:MAG: helix-turn-helix transcriptional regulator [Candidatus Dormibacteria bacterium]